MRASIRFTLPSPSSLTLDGTLIPHVHPPPSPFSPLCSQHPSPASAAEPLNLSLQVFGLAMNVTCTAGPRALLLKPFAPTAVHTSATFSLESATRSQTSGTESTQSAWFVDLPPSLPLSPHSLIPSSSTSCRCTSMKTPRRLSPKRTRCASCASS